MTPEQIQETIVKETKNCLEDYLLFFQNWYVPEVYPQCYCAMRLMSKFGHRVMLEVRPEDLEIVVDSSLGDLSSLGRYRVDLALFGSGGGRRTSDLRSIIEFKRSTRTDLLDKDIRRTTLILHALRKANVLKPFGLQILFTIHNKETAGESVRDIFCESLDRAGGKSWSSPWPRHSKPYVVATAKSGVLYYTVHGSILLTS